MVALVITVLMLGRDNGFAVLRLFGSGTTNVWEQIKSHEQCADHLMVRMQHAYKLANIQGLGKDIFKKNMLASWQKD